MGAPISFIAGQDPLGLLNTSDRAFNVLLPGLNNVTERIRFYSFYCWFFEFYAKEIGVPIKEQQFKYLRRSELILSLISVHNGQQGVPGNTKATELYNGDEELIKLSLGTKENADTREGSYWKNPRGVFGQNYKSSLEFLGVLVERKDSTDVFIRTDFDSEDRISGRKLAAAFAENVGDEIEVFKDCILNGELSRLDIELLAQPLNMRSVPLETKEHKLLWSLLIGQDNPNKASNRSYYRRETIKYLMEAQVQNNGRGFSDLEFTNDCYLSKGFREEVDQTTLLWYYFQVEQFWHVACTGVLKGFLMFLQENYDGGWAVEREVVNQYSIKAVQSLCNIFECDSNSTAEDIGFEGSELDLDLKIRNANSTNKLSYSVLLINKLIEENKPHLKALRQTGIKFSLIEQSSLVNNFEKLSQLRSKPLLFFARNILMNHVVLRHQFVALAKMNDSQSTEKFIREDGLIRFIEPIDYGFSSPRINTIIGFLKDLNLLDQSAGALTPSGMDAFKMLPS